MSVKAGKTGPAHVRDLRGVVERENAAIGLLITMEEPTAAMRRKPPAPGSMSASRGIPNIRKSRFLRSANCWKARNSISRPARDLRTFKNAPKAKRTPKRGGGSLLLF